ncbi:MAG: LysM peptidoglycan-binding domain-containing protein [Candidatus Levyibacteriota bacterium]
MAKKAVTNNQSTAQEEPQEKRNGVFEYLRFGESYTSLILGIIVVIIATALLLSFVHNKNAKNVNTPITQDAQNNIELSQKANNMAQKAPSQINDKSQTTTTPTQTVTLTEQPTATPKPTAAPKPKATPKPTAKPKPTEVAIAKKSEPTKVPVRKPIPTKVPQFKTDKDNNVWTVQKGESLWTIAEKKYNNGYNWVDIARANNLSNPSTIHAGDKLKLPSIKSSEQNNATVRTDDEQNSSTVQKNTTATDQMAKITGRSYDVVRGDNLWNIAVRAYGDGFRWVDIARANNLANPRVIHAGNHFVIPR